MDWRHLEESQNYAQWFCNCAIRGCFWTRLDMRIQQKGCPSKVFSGFRTAAMCTRMAPAPAPTKSIKKTGCRAQGLATKASIELSGPKAKKKQKRSFNLSATPLPHLFGTKYAF